MSQFELGCSGKEGHRHNVVQPRNRFRHALAWKPWLPHHTRRMWRHSRRKVDSEFVDQRAHGNISGHPQCLQLKSVRIPGERVNSERFPSEETEKLVNFPLAFPSYFDYNLAGSKLQHKDVRKYINWIKIEGDHLYSKRPPSLVTRMIVSLFVTSQWSDHWREK